MKLFGLFFILTFLASSFSLAQKEANIIMKNPRVILVPPTATTSAVFGQLINNSSEDITISSLSSNCAKSTELHISQEQNGKWSMRNLTNFIVKKNSTLILKHRSYHIMLINLISPLKLDKKCHVEIKFQNKTEKLTFQAPVVRL